MNLRSIRVGRLAGIPIGFQPLWLLIVALIAWSLGAAYYPDQDPGISPALAYALGLFSALLLFASILLHELGHAIVARRHGLEIEEIDLWLLGGVARINGQPDQPADELRFALAGPAVTAVIALAFAALAAALPESAPDALAALVEYQAFVNLAILVFNMLPAFPLDGGRVARSLFWMRTGNVVEATALAAQIGRGFGYGMVGLGVLLAAAGAVGGLWLLLIGVFLIVAARGEESGVRIRAAFSGREAGRFMSFPAITIPAGATLAEAVDRFFVEHRFSAFPVVEPGRGPGLITFEGVARVPEGERAGRTVGDTAVFDPQLVISEHQDVAGLLERPAFAEIGRAVVVTESGRLGILSITDVNRAIRALGLKSGGPAGDGSARTRPESPA